MTSGASGQLRDRLAVGHQPLELRTVVRIHVPEPSAPELIDMGEEAIDEDERKDLLLDLVLALVDKHDGLTVLALSE